MKVSMPQACSVDLLGRGAAPSRKSVAGTLSDTNMVSLYRRLILDYWCETGESSSQIARHVLIHEIGDHSGLSDEDMEQIKDQG